MKKYRLNISNILVLFYLLSSCSTGKTLNTVASNEAKAESKKVSILTDEKKTEFEYLFIEGLKQKSVGNINIAQQQFITCLEIDPNSGAARFELANIYASKGDINGAISLVTQAIDINENNKWYKLFAAQLFQRNQEFGKASAVYKKLIQQYPNEVDFYYLDALMLTSSKDYKAALDAYNLLEKQVGYNDQIALSRQQLYREAGQNKEAYKEIEQLIKENPSIPEYYGVMADMYKDDGNMDQALEFYHKVLDIDSLNGFVHFSLANYYAEQQNIEKAFEHAMNGFKNPEVEIETKIQFYLMHNAVSDENHLSSSQLESLTKILVEVHPNDARSYGIAADYLINQEKTSEAREYLYQSLENDPNSYRTWEQLVLIDNELLDWKRMNNDSEKAIELFPNQPLLYVLSAVAKIQLKEYSKTLAILEKGFKYVIDNPRMEAQFHLYIAEANYNLENKDAAFSSFDKVLVLEPDNYMAMNNYAYYLSVNAEQLEKAEKLSGTVIQANPENATYLDTHAWVLFKKGEYRLAKFYIENALKFGGNESDVIVEHYGDILIQLNDVAGALKAWNESILMGNESEILKQKIEQKVYLEGEE